MMWKMMLDSQDSIVAYRSLHMDCRSILQLVMYLGGHSWFELRNQEREIEKSKNGVNSPTGTLRNGKDMLTCPTEHGRISRRSQDQ